MLFTKHLFYLSGAVSNGDWDASGGLVLKVRGALSIKKIGSTNRENRGKFSLVVLPINEKMVSVRVVKDLYVICSSRCCSRSSSLELFCLFGLFVFYRFPAALSQQ